MQNIEIKAKYENLAEAQQIAEGIDADFVGVLHQLDTYFHIKRGRLKLREIASEGAQLIYYERPANAGPKMSEYQIYPVSHPEELKTMLKSALGVWKVVEKKRQLYLFENVRIHLDRVTNLGNFLELEGVISKHSAHDTTESTVRKLLEQFDVAASDLISTSYSDLIS